MQPYLCIYGHFYQPPREDPFSGRIPREEGAAPFRNFNEKITAECYRPNALAGNFEQISFDLGPTLADWLYSYDSETYTRIIQADKRNVERYGVGNALAQAYNHTILPLATRRDRYTQIRWGIADFQRRFGRMPEGMWLAETAVDELCLDILAECGIRYTVLAPWQAATLIDPTEPYLVYLPSGRSITVFFYNSPLSSSVSFEPESTSNADTFALNYLPAQLDKEKLAAGLPQLTLIATDGELYGHHKTWRDRFLTYLLHDAGNYDFQVTTLSRYLHEFPATKAVKIKNATSWSCHHGVARWSTGCACTEGDSSWKKALRTALDNLAKRVDTIYADPALTHFCDPWAARDDYSNLRSGVQTLEQFWREHSALPWDETESRPSFQLLEAQYYIQYAYTSCAFFFEDLERIEPRNSIAYARRAIGLVWEAAHISLEAGFLFDLLLARSRRSGRTGVDIYRNLSPVSTLFLPPQAAHNPQCSIAPQPAKSEDQERGRSEHVREA